MTIAAWSVLAPAAAAPNGEESEPIRPVDPESPRAAVAAYLELARAGALESASAFLQVPANQAERGGTLAERLKFVLERHDATDLDALSAKPEGNVTDGLPSGVDRVALIPSETREDELLLTRAPTRAGVRWVFTEDSVRKVDRWYDELDELWLLEMLPEPLRRSGPWNVLYWQWGALALVLLTGWVLGLVLGKVTITSLTRLAARTSPTWDDELVMRKRGPVSLLWAAAVCWLFLPLVGLYPGAHATALAIVRLVLWVALLWALTRAADVAAANAIRGEWARRNPVSQSLIPVASRLLKLLVFVLAIVGLLSELGYPVVSLVAGLGVGGLAVALAARKTLENLFGALSIALDQPLHEGELVRVGAFLGTVETIGLRSTQIRTLQRTLVTIPNGSLAEMQIESLAARDRIRFECKIHLVHSTRAAQLRRVLDELERLLREHEKVWPEIDVHLIGYAESSLELQVWAWICTVDYSEFLAVREELLLEFLAVIEATGTRLAYPTQTLRMGELDFS
jgi:MscS family membrane protein